MRKHAKALLAISALLLTLAIGVTLALAAAPVVSIDPASEVRYTTAHVSGTVDPEDQETYWSFEVNPEGEGWSGFTFQGPFFAGEGPQNVSTDLSGLKPGTEYKLRLVANNFIDPEVVSAEESFTTDAVAKPSPSEVTVSSIDGGSAHFSATVDPNAPESAPVSDPLVEEAFKASWHFECEPACPGSLNGEVPADDQPNAVEVDAEKLQPNTEYKVRLVASNAGGSEESAQKDFKTAAVPPTIGKLVNHQSAGGNVAIGGFVNPHNSAITDCEFSFGPTKSYGQSIPCEALPPTNNQSSLVKAQVSGLTPGATYHFMLSVATAAGTTDGADRAFTALSSPSQSDCVNAGRPGVGELPDCRAWEMVSPQDKNGGNVPAVSLRTRAAADGSAAQFFSLTGFAGVEGMGVAADYIARRSTDPDPGNQGWSTHAITPPQDPLNLGNHLSGGEPKYVGTFSQDFSAAVFLGTTPLTEAPSVANAANLYRRGDVLSPGAGNYQLLTDCLSSPLGPCTSPIPPIIATGKVPSFAGASADLSHVVYESALKLTNDAPASPFVIKLYESTGGAPHLVGVLPAGQAAPRAISGRGFFGGRFSSHTITSDGSRIFFTVPPNSSSSEGDLYARINARSTVQLNASERSTPDAEAEATYWDASTDGRRVFFTTAEALTIDAPEGPSKLYMWEQAETNETQSVEVDASGGSFTLSFHGISTEPIAFDAPASGASSVQSALEALKGPAPEERPLLAPGSLSVTGGASPYLVAFEGDLAGANVAEMSADGSGLSGGASTAAVETTQPVKNLTYLSVDEEPSDGGAGTVEGAVGASSGGDRVYFISGGQLVPGAPIPSFGSLGLYLWDEGEIEFVGALGNFVGDQGALLDGNFLNLRLKQSHVTSEGHLVFASSSGEGLLSVHGGDDYDHGTCPGSTAACTEIYVYNPDSGELQCASCNPSGAPATAAAETRSFRSEQLGGAQHASYLIRPLSDDGRYAFFSTAERLVSEDTNGVSDAYVYDTTTGEPRLLSSGESPEPSYFLDSSADGHDAFFNTSERLSGWDVDGNYDLYDARVDGGFPEPPPPPPSCVGDACQPPPLDLNDSTPASSAFHGSGDPADRRKAKARCPQGKRKIKARDGKGRCVKRTKKKRNANSNRRAGR